MMDIDQLKSEILIHEPRDFVEKHIIRGVNNYVTDKQLEIIQNSVSRATGIKVQPCEIIIVGSAKLGYGLFEKKQKDQDVLPAFRPFSGNSDIDIAFVSSTLFDAVWNELASYAHGKPWMPHRMDKLGDYLVYGWIRPDHIPREARLRTYDIWRDTIRRLTASTYFHRRKLSGALYRDLEFLTKYQARGIAHCKAILESL
jgi:hypothetical protein